MSLGVNVTIKTKGESRIDLDVISLDCRYECHGIPEATVVLDAGETATGEFKPLDDAELQNGGTIELQLNYGPGAGTSVFKGLITGQNLNVNQSGARWQLNCHGDLVKLVEPRMTKKFAPKKKDSDIIAELLKAAGVTVKTPPKATKEEYPQMVLFDDTPWSFVKYRAEANGFLVLPAADGVSVAAPADLKGAEVPLKLDELIAVDLTLDDTNALNAAKVKTGSWSVLTQEALTSADTSIPSVTNAKHTAETAAKELGWADRDALTAMAAQSLSLDELNSWRSGELLYRELDRIKGQLISPGRSDINPGDKVTLTKLGKAFSHQFLVTGVRHKIDASGWQTVLRIGLPITRTGFFKGLHRQSSAIRGLLVGQVMDDYAKKEEGRDKLYRIRVKVPALGEKDNEVYARLASPFASKDAGFFFPPKKDDEVVLGWFGASPSEPVILGSMHNAKSPPPAEYDKKMQRGLVYDKEKLSWLYTDDGGKLTHVLALKGEKGSLALKEGKLDAELDKQKLAVAADIALESGGKLDFKAGGNCTIEAPAVDIK